jgi:hypothetical protein
MTMRSEVVEFDPVLYPVPPPRDQLPTLPYDLSEYARVHTGPDAEIFDDVCSGTMLRVGYGRVPRVAVTRADLEACALDHREGFILSLLDGTSSVEAILDVAGMPEGEALLVLGELYELGIVAFD